MAATSDERGGGALALAAVFVGAAGFAACLTAVYMAMRDLMINSGGACASGGPYQINPDQVCSTGQTALLMGGIFGGLVFAAILVGASGWYGGVKLSGVGLLLWAALFGALGYNFIPLGLNPPPSLNGGAAGWIISGVVFWLMALGGLIPGLMALASYFKDSANPEEAKPVFDTPIVRANVEFVRSMPGDPMFGQSDPNAMSRPPAAEQAPARTVEPNNDFIDPVTGERAGGDDG
ncbi:MAG: hypothetical protein JHD02_01195 [Thermoleophilaceae bacterium]|nr:hypothetical protein [Thermoleophilaceae bacterium]